MTIILLGHYLGKEYLPLLLGLEENFSHLEVSNLSSVPGQNSQGRADDGCVLKLSNCLIESTDYLIDYRNNFHINYMYVYYLIYLLVASPLNM